MRILIVGSSVAANFEIAKHFLNDSNVTWDVSCSYQETLEKWSELSMVKKTYAASLKTKPEIMTEGHIFQVQAGTFYNKEWVKYELANAAQLMVLTSTPSQLGPRETLKFDRIFVAKTISPEKASQYFHQFILPKSGVTEKDFKQMVKNLDFSTNEYVDVTSGSPVRHPKSEIKSDISILPSDYLVSRPREDLLGRKTEDLVSRPREDLLKPKGDVLKPAKELIRIEEIKAEEKIREDDKVVTITAIRSENDPTNFKIRPNKVVIKENTSEIWIVLTPTVDSAETVNILEDMLSNQLLTSMFDKAFHEVLQSKISVYFQVFKHRQDLFVALLVSILQALRARGVISDGFLVI